MSEHAVVIVGGGPTGLMLAGDLAREKVDVAVVERRATQDLAGLRAGGLHMRTLEMLDQRGIVDRFVSRGKKHQLAPFAGGVLDISDSPTRHNYFLALWQTHVEKILAEWVLELGVTIYRGDDVTGCEQDDAGVTVERRDSPALRARYVVGCDGGRSVVRKGSGIDFPGWDATTSYLIAEIETADEPEWGLRRGARGMTAIGKLEGGQGARVVLSEPLRESRETPGLQDVRDALVGAYGRDFGIRPAQHVSRFTDAARQAAAYRAARVLLAGDAAHVHSPIGGQGLNLGMQDAMNLGWKLARVVRGSAPESLLDTYHAERHPVGARVLRNTLALTALERADERTGALREMLSEMMRDDGARQFYVEMTSGLDVRYELGNGHSLLGRRLRDTPRSTKPVLVNFGRRGHVDVGPWADEVRSIDAGLGSNMPAAVLVRPDGYVAWVGDENRVGLDGALTRWFGPRPRESGRIVP